MALGAVDYGLVGVIGGLSAFISFFNGLLSGAIGRFYAFAVGQSHVAGKEVWGLEECRRWFSIAVLIHTVIPCLLMLVGFPVGMWAVNHFLTIPADRISDCRWVFCFVCVTCFVGMVNVPFNAMYVAKQYIAELTVYSFVASTFNALFLYYMVTHAGNWLVRYSLWTCLVAIVPQAIICARALVVFKECRFVSTYCCDLRRIGQIFNYAFWCFFCNLGGLVRSQGVSVLVNKYFGPTFNATLTLGNSVAMHAESLAAALCGAFNPAITNMAGAGDREKMLKYSYRASKFGTVLCLLFSVPLILELPYVLKLWLKNPPGRLDEVCVWTLVYVLLGLLFRGIDAAVFAVGKISLYASVIGAFMIFSLPVNWVLIHYDFCGFISVCYVLVAFRAMGAFLTLPMARHLTGFDIKYFLVRVVLPIAITATVVFLVGWLPHLLLGVGFLRLIVTIGISEASLLPLVWMVVLDCDERVYVLGQFQKRIPKGVLKWVKQ